MNFYIKAIGGIPYSEDACAAWYGLLQRGSKVILYEDITDVPLFRDNCIIGDIEDTRFFFEK